MECKEIWATVVNYTFGEETDFAKRMINAVETREVKIDDFKELIIEMRKQLKKHKYINCSTEGNTDDYKIRFGLASRNTVKNNEYGGYEIDGILYNNKGTIDYLYGEEIKQWPTNNLTHIYYNELDHYFTHVLNFYPLVEKGNRDKLLALQIPPRNVGTAAECGIYAVICDSLIGSKKCKLKIDENELNINNRKEYKAVIIRILKSEDLVKCGR